MEHETVKSLTDLIQAVGFPILVASWFMWRMEKRLESMTLELSRLNTLLATRRKDDGA